MKSKIVHASASNHKPVVVILDRLENQGLIPFKYNKLWDSKEDFGKLIRESSERNVIGSPHYVWETKLKIKISTKSMDKRKCSQGKKVKNRTARET